MSNCMFALAPPAGLSFALTRGSSMDSRSNPPMAASHSSGELVTLLEGIASGDRAALSTLYERTSAKLYGICVRLLSSEAEAEDALQETYVTVWRSAARFDPTKASPITWLAVVARNKSIDRLRRKTFSTETIDAAADIPDGGPTAFEVVQRDQDSERLSGCLDELEEKPRSMIRAAFLDGASYPELAEREGVPLGTMKSWIRRALLRLRGCLEQ
jgi:RNA polymerase sigma factor (sigma-70 family)